MDWENWTDKEVDREIVEIKSAGFNFVRIPVYFHRFISFETLTFSPNRSQVFYDKLVYFLNSLKNNGLFVEPVPMEPWKFGDKMTLWWTDSTLQERISFFYETYAKWCKDMGWNNIVYITLWSEASFYFEWADGAYVVDRKMPNYNETNEDWKMWLSQNGIYPVELTIDNINRYIDQYVAWSRSIFITVTQIKANAVKEGWPGMLTAGEMGYPLESCGTGPAYHPSRYLQLCAKQYVDVLCLHDYSDSTGWIMEPYLELAKGKKVVVNEVGPPFYRGIWANNTDSWWSYMKPKLELARTTCGYAIWSWKDYDYDSRPWGLKDMNFNPRPVLQLMIEWLGSS